MWNQSVSGLLTPYEPEIHSAFHDQQIRGTKVKSRHGVFKLSLGNSPLAPRKVSGLIVGRIYDLFEKYSLSAKTRGAWL
jgi:hypothetical protein